ncbi:hypothetical protein KKC45_02450 [Patescibacteria group bacterium]|nr:hypothetical protein [Patescibacteria group bacterium]
MEARGILLKIVTWVSLIPLFIIGYYGVPYYWEKMSAGRQQDRFDNENRKAIEATKKDRKTYGPWTMKELKEEGWTKVYKRVAPPNGKLSRVWTIGQFKTAEFSTNPPGQDVYFMNDGEMYELNENPGNKEGKTWNLNIFFGSRTGKRVTIYIREGPQKN